MGQEGPHSDPFSEAPTQAQGWQMTPVTPLSAQPPGHKRNSHPHQLAVSCMLGRPSPPAGAAFSPTTQPPSLHSWFQDRRKKVLKPHSQALRGYDYLGLSRITFPLYQALWQTRHNQTVAMATRTSFGASQSPEWQNGVLLLVAAARPDFLRGHPEQRDNGQPLPTPPPPPTPAAAWPAR